MISLKLFLVLIALNAGLSTALVCPKYTFNYGVYCLMGVPRTTFERGVRLCKIYGGRLIEPRSKSATLILSYHWAGASKWFGVVDNRYISTGELIDFEDGIVRSADKPGAVFTNPDGSWSTTTDKSVRHNVLCEFPRLSTKCISLGQIFVEDFFPVASSRACAEACKITQGCKFWIYYPSSCGLRFYSPGYMAGGPSELITGFPNGTEHSGSVLVGNAVKNVETAADCQILCSKDPKCNTFTWIYVYNEKLCVFNYGKTVRKINLITDPANYPVAYSYIGSGDSTCKIETGVSDNKRRERSSEDMPSDEDMPSAEELQHYQEELEAILRSEVGHMSTVTNTTVGQ